MATWQDCRIHWLSDSVNPAILQSCPSAMSGASRRDRDALHREDFDDIADLDVIELLEPDAALEPALHFADIVLEAAQRSDLALVDHDVVAQQPRLRVTRARDASLGDDADGNRSVISHLDC